MASVLDATISLFALALFVNQGGALATQGSPQPHEASDGTQHRLGAGFSGGLASALGRQARGVLSKASDPQPTVLALSTQLSAGFECAPTAPEILAAGLHSGKSQVGPSGEGGQRPFRVTFYLHEGGVFDLSHRVNCFYSAIHKGGTWNYSKWNYSNLNGKHDDADKHVMPNVAEHLTDAWIVKQLRNHSARTMDPNAADFHIVGAGLRTSWFASQLDSQECGSEVDHFQYVDGIVDALRSQETFQKTGGRNYVFIDTDWNWNLIFGHRLSALVRDHHAVLATVDSTIASFGGVEESNVLVLPYKVHYSLENAAFEEDRHNKGLQGSPQKHVLAKDLKGYIQHRRDQRPFSFTYHGDLMSAAELDDRNVTFTFHGTMARIREGRYRTSLGNIGAGLNNSSVLDVRFSDFNVEEVAKVAQKTAATLMRSAFCFVPSGDTPSSRRLFDALAAGCVPIIFNELSHIATNLPFRDLIDWSQIAIFAGSAQCMAMNIDKVVTWLRRLADANNNYFAMKVELMRARGRKVYVQHLSYRSSGISDGFVSELERIRSERNRADVMGA